MAEVVKTGGGRYQADEEPIYFLAGGLYAYTNGVEHPWSLVAVNELMGRDEEVAKLGRLLENTNVRLLLDSGIFWLTQRHKRAHDVTMDEALALAPEEIDGFGGLFDAYVSLVRQFEDRLWGYIELDQGGAENKKRTRRKLEELGLRPIPVYHPLNDGWDYFDELAEQYDRICLGNVVQAKGEARRHLLATLWERKRRYPGLWVHVLGLTPNETTTVYPPNSADSSSWMGAMRYGAESAKGWAMGDTFGRLPETFSYFPPADREDPNGYRAGVKFFASEAYFVQEGWRRQKADVEKLIGSVLPAHDDRERVRR